MGDESKRVLLIASERSMVVGTVREHVESLIKISQNKIIYYDYYFILKNNMELTIFDAIVLHYSVVISHIMQNSQSFAKMLSEFSGPKILFIQDEYRWVDQTAEAIRTLGIDHVFTVVNDDVIRKIYHHPWLRNITFETALTGYVPEALTTVDVPEFENRIIDVSYRARKLPAWCGSFGQEKWRIGERFLRDAKTYGLNCDIASSEGSRIYGNAWINFVVNSKAVLGTESGSSFIDFTGEVTPRIDRYANKHGGATFDEIKERFLEGRDGEIVIRVISPRCFEAAALRTLMILYPGDYSGALRPHEHYVPLLPDHSNMDEVVSVLRNPEAARRIIDQAYHDVALSDKWTFQTFVRRFDDVLAGLFAQQASLFAQQETRRNAQTARASDAAFQQQIDLLRARMRRWNRIQRVKIWFAVLLKRLENRLSVFDKSDMGPFTRVTTRGIRTSIAFLKPYARRMLLGKEH